MKISLEQTGRITLFVLAVTLFTGCLVTGLLLTMWMRGRKTEIAVYVSLGLGKRNLLYQAASEGLVLYLASFCLSGILLPEVFGSLGMPENTAGSGTADWTGSLWILGCGMCMVIVLTVTAVYPYLIKHPKEILAEMEG